MAKAVQKITLSASRDIPFNRLVLSQSNVRHVKANVSIEELADDIARRTLLQSLTVRPVLDESGAETGMFEIPAGGRRYRALELLVKQKRLSRTAAIPCVVRTEGIAEEDSLAENVQRAPLHPLDQFRAFLALREKGQSEDEIAAAFFVAVSVVRQRLRLASVSPKLLDIYAQDAMTLDQLMAFSVSPDHERQERVWDAVQRAHTREPYQVRRLLTEGAVRASDKRAQYAGAEYMAAGGAIMRDLFQQDDGGWLQDVGLLDRAVGEKLARDAAAVRAEGWKWVEVATDFPYGHTYGMRLITGEQPMVTEEASARLAALRTEAEQLEETYAAAEEFPEEADQRMSEIETAIAAIESRPAIYTLAELGRAGAFVSIDGSGNLRVERGYVRAEDETPIAQPEAAEPEGESDPSHAQPATAAPAPVGNGAVEPQPTEEDEGIRPLPDKLLTELTAHRTLALRDAIGADPATAFLAMLHVLCLKLFYRYGLDSCLEIEAKSVAFGSQAPGLADMPLAARVDARHRAWAERLPEDMGALWDALQAFDRDSRDALFAHCVSLTVNAVHDAWNRRPKAIAHADRLADAVSLDMAAAGWSPTVDNFLGRVTKARILAAVREAKGDAQAQLIDHLKKGEMAAQAEQLLAGSGWLPEPLRAAGYAVSTPARSRMPPSQREARLRRPKTNRLSGRCRKSMTRPHDRWTPSPPSRSQPTAVCEGTRPKGRVSFVAKDPLMSISAAELARRLARDAEAVCRHYLSNGRREGRYWLVGDIRNTPGRSLFVRLTGPDAGKGRAGKWRDAATGEHGDLLDVIRETSGLTDFREAADEAGCFLAMPRREPDRAPQPSSVAAGSPESARRLFAMSQPITGTIAEAYLRHRGIAALHGTGSLRFHPRCYHRQDPCAPTETWPAIIAAVTDLRGTITGAHRTWLHPSGHGKAPVGSPRRAMGHLLGNAVRFDVAHDVLAAGEGIETILSLRCVMPTMPMAVALSAAHLAAFRFPATLRRLYIARDDDRAGDGAMTCLIDRTREAGIEAITLSPRLGDFNDDLRALGIVVLRAALSAQIARDDVARFLAVGKSARAAERPAGRR